MTKRSLVLTLIASCMNKRAEQILRIFQVLAGTDPRFITITFKELIDWHLEKGVGHRMYNLLKGVLEGIDDISQLPPKIVAKALQEYVDDYSAKYQLESIAQVFVAGVPSHEGHAAAFTQAFEQVEVIHALANVSKRTDHNQGLILEAVLNFERKGRFVIELSPAAPLSEQIENVLKYVEIGDSKNVEWADICANDNAHPAYQLVHEHTQGASSRSQVPDAQPSAKSEQHTTFPLGAVIAATA